MRSVMSTKAFCPGFKLTVSGLTLYLLAHSGLKLCVTDCYDGELALSDIGDSEAPLVVARSEGFDEGDFRRLNPKTPRSSAHLVIKASVESN